MNKLIPQWKLGDITFGIPPDMKLLHKPWGYYEFLGVPKEASPEEIKSAYRRLAAQLHPNAGGDAEAFKALKTVRDILLDNGGALGPEYGRRTHYDMVSSLDSYFDGFVEHEGQRTKKLSEIMLIRMEMEKKSAEIGLEINQSPEFAELRERLENAASPQEKERASDELLEAFLNSKGIDFEEAQNSREQAEERHKAELQEFIQAFGQNPAAYWRKVLDVFYVGNGFVTFGKSTGIKGSLLAHIDREHVLELIMAGNCYISGFPQVHFKAPQANVTIRDPNLEGIVHVIEGSVAVAYERSSYGKVIRARSPKTSMISGFAQKGDLFVPETFATGSWWEGKPALDIAVQQGAVSLELASPTIGSRNNIFYGNLETILGKLKDNNDKFYNKYRI